MANEIAVKVASRPSVDWGQVNFPARLWRRDKNIVLAIALVAIAVDIMRVLPLTVYDIAMEAPKSFSPFIGAADFLIVAFLIAAFPSRRSAIVAIIGAIVVIASQAIIGLPALSGWLAICLPWAIANVREFHLSRREKFYLAGAVVAILCWSVVVWAGHVVPPPMQRIGWFYESQPTKDIRPGDVVTFRAKALGTTWPIMSRISRVTDTEVTLVADDRNLDAAESTSGTTISRHDLAGLRKVTSAWSPKRCLASLNPRGRLLNRLRIMYPEAWIEQSQWGVVVEETIPGVAREECCLIRYYRQAEEDAEEFRGIFDGWTADGRLRFMVKRGPEFWIKDENGRLLEHTKLE